MVLTLWIAVFGGLGATARFVSDGTIRAALGRSFPWGTLIVNATGSFILGVMTGLALYGHLSHNLLLVIGTGFCGGFTTFSTASFEAVRLIEKRQFLAVFAHVTGNVVLCFLAAAVGLWLVY